MTPARYRLAADICREALDDPSASTWTAALSDAAWALDRTADQLDTLIAKEATR